MKKLYLFFILFIAYFPTFSQVSRDDPQQSQAALEKKRAMITVLQRYFPDKTIEEYNLGSYNNSDFLLIELESYERCMQHIAGQIEKSKAREEKLAPIRASIREASGEELRKLLVEHEDLINANIPFVDLTDEKGQHCQQLFEVNRRVMERQAAEEKQ